MQQNYIFVSDLSSTGHSHIGSLFTNEEQKEKNVACEVVHTSGTHASFVRDVTDTTAGYKMVALTVLVW